MNPDTIYKTQPYVKMTQRGPAHIEEWMAINPGLPDGQDHFFCITINIMTPQGPGAVTHRMEAQTIQGAFDTFGDEFKRATDNIKQELSKPRIAVPPMPPGGKIQLQ